MELIRCSREMKQTDVKITRFEVGEFNIDIVESADAYEAWLSHKDYGISSLIFGLPL